MANPMLIAGGISLASKLFGGGGGGVKEAKRNAALAKQMQGLEQQWDKELGESGIRKGVATGDRIHREVGVDDAVSRIEGMRPTETAGFRPDRIDAVDTSGLRNFDATNVRGVNFDALEGATPNATAGLGDTGAGFERFANRSAGGIDFTPRDFDAGAAVEQYARGATSDFMKQSGKALDDLRARSVAAGRIDTGLFDSDQGDVMTELGRGLTSDIAKQAVAAAGITSTSRTNADQMKLDALKYGKDFELQGLEGAAKYRTQQAKTIDDNMLERGTQLGKLQLERGTTMDDARLKGVQGALDADVDLAKAGDDLTLDRNRFIDEFTQRNAETGLDARDRQAGRASDREENETNRYLDILHGRTNRTQDLINASQQKKAARNQGTADAIGLGLKAYSTFK